jgi:PAS domain S-box-containing protein
MYSILYVDDEPIFRDLISLFLPKFGEFSIDLAEDPDTGLIMHQEKKYDAIISDFEMPGSNGITFLINIRSTGDKTPFILFTGKSREEMAVEALNWGADHYLHKSGCTDQFRELAHVTVRAIQRHQSIEEVKRSRQEMKDIISHLPDPTFAINSNGTVIAWNEAMVELTGVNAESMLGTGDYTYSIPFFGKKRPLLLDYLLTHDLPEPEKYQKIVRNHTGITGTCSIQMDGIERIFWIKATVLRDSEGSITGAIESLRDTTERVRLLRSMRDSRKNLENIINHLPDAAFVINHTGTVIAWNKEMERITGVPQGAAIGNRDSIHALSLYGDRQKTLADHLLSGSHPIPEDYEFLNYIESSITGLSDGRFLNKESDSYLKTASVLHTTTGDFLVL